MLQSENLVACSHVKRIFFDGPRRIEVLKDVNLHVAKGEMIAVVGPSGSGKTTLLNIMACLDKPTSGEVSIEGVIINQLSDDELSKIRRHKIGMMFQDFYLLPSLTTLENVEVPMIFDDVLETERKERAAKLLSLVELSDRAHYRPWELSGGEQQRVAIARALSNDPKIILADEPTGNLDTTTGRRIVTLLRKIVEKRDKAILMVTHDPDAALRAHKVWILRGGVLHAETNEGPLQNE